MNANLEKTFSLGQSIWYDSISRKAIRGGELQNLLDEGVRGVTTNPSIFQKALSSSTDYDGDLKKLFAEGHDDNSVYDELTVSEVREACAVFKPLYDSSKGLDGFVSLEVNPLIADDTETTVSEAKRLWKKLGCRNAMIKIPATPAGIKAMEEVLAAGVNVNATLIFSLEQYDAVAKAFLAAMKRRVAAGEKPDMASVASVFVSRIDKMVDPVLGEEHKDLAGQVAVANARSVYARFKELFSGETWKLLEEKGAHCQRPLWASTGVKNPEYPDTLYTDELIGAYTVNTLPPASLKAFMDHGSPACRVETPEWEDVLAALDGVVSLKEVTDKLLADGLKSFEDSFRDMMAIIASKRPCPEK